MSDKSDLRKSKSSGKTKSTSKTNPARGTVRTAGAKAKTKSKTSSKESAKAKADSSTKGKAANAKSKGSTKLADESVSPQMAAEMMKELCRLYPDADCELSYENDYQLLTAVILSAQTTDVQVNKVTPALFKRFPSPEALARADIEKIKELIKATGYYNNKAKAIQACAQALLDNFGGKVPDTLEELTTLPGVGRKTANVVLGVIHKIPGWTVDTHVQRLSKRLGFSRQSDPYKIELELQNLFPDKDWSKYSITLIWHGRRICFARNPNCFECPINRICPSSLVP